MSGELDCGDVLFQDRISRCGESALAANGSAKRRAIVDTVRAIEAGETRFSSKVDPIRVAILGSLMHDFVKC